MLGQAAIKHTGIQGGLPDDYLASGIHAVNREGYLGITAEDSLFQFNAGHGVYVYDVYSIRAQTHFPMGLFLGLRRCASHDNDGSGIALDGMKDKGTIQMVFQGADVGGTHDNFAASSATTNYLGGVSFIAEGDEPVPANRPHGQGYIDRCAISHNGGAGVWTYLRGSVDRNSLPGAIAAGPWSVASCRIENAFLWENTAGGVRADLHPTFANDVDGPLYLMPVVHSTLAHNGSTQAAPFNMEIAMAKPSGFLYSGDPSGVTVQTELFNSIFERTTPTDLDWGPGLEALVADDRVGTGPWLTPAHDYVGVAGVRASWSSNASGMVIPPVTMNGLGGGSGAPFPTPFVGPGGWGPNDPDQFFLTGSGNTAFYASPPFFTVKTAETDCKKDYSGDDRPTGGFTQWDKGGEEL